MGTKFANIQVRTNDIQEVQDAITKYHSLNKLKKDGQKAHFAKILGLENMILTPSEETYFIGNITENWTIVLNEDFSWENIVDFSLDLSRYVQSPLVSFGYFDDDVFELNLFRQGEHITKILVCNEGTAEDYGLEVTNGDVDILLKVLDLDISGESVEEILSQNVMDLIEPLEEVFNTAISIKADWLDSFDEEFRSQFNTIIL